MNETVDLPRQQRKVLKAALRGPLQRTREGRWTRDGQTFGAPSVCSLETKGLLLVSRPLPGQGAAIATEKGRALGAALKL